MNQYSPTVVWSAIALISLTTGSSSLYVIGADVALELLPNGFHRSSPFRFLLSGRLRLVGGRHHRVINKLHRLFPQLEMSRDIGLGDLQEVDVGVGLFTAMTIHTVLF